MINTVDIAKPLPDDIYQIGDLSGTVTLKQLITFVYRRFISSNVTIPYLRTGFTGTSKTSRNSNISILYWKLLNVRNNITTIIHKGSIHITTSGSGVFKSPNVLNTIPSGETTLELLVGSIDGLVIAKTPPINLYIDGSLDIEVLKVLTSDVQFYHCLDWCNTVFTSTPEGFYLSNIT